VTSDNKTEKTVKDVASRCSESVNVGKLLDTSVLSNTMGFEGQERAPIFFRSKSTITLLANSKQLLDCPQVNQSLARVPIEYVVLKNLKKDSDPQLPVTDAYFSMPLYHLLNQEQINFNSPDLPHDDLEFLCQRYSDEAAFVTGDESAAELREVQFRHLLNLRTKNEL